MAEWMAHCPECGKLYRDVHCDIVCVHQLPMVGSVAQFRKRIPPKPRYSRRRCVAFYVSAEVKPL